MNRPVFGSCTVVIVSNVIFTNKKDCHNALSLTTMQKVIGNTFITINILYIIFPKKLSIITRYLSLSQKNGNESEIEEIVRAKGTATHC